MTETCSSCRIPGQGGAGAERSPLCTSIEVWCQGPKTSSLDNLSLGTLPAPAHSPPCRPQVLLCFTVSVYIAQQVSVCLNSGLDSVGEVGSGS